jgi:hypothetical protein
VTAFSSRPESRSPNQSTADTQFYWANHPATVSAYDLSAVEQHRDWAVQAVTDLGAATVLEVGCHCGPVLGRLEAAGLRACGIDINAGAVAAAQAHGFSAVVGAVPSTLERYDDGAFDVVLSSYCLAYIAPHDLPDTLAAMMRVALFGLVLVEPMAGAGVPEQMTRFGSYTEWRHDYLTALELAQPLVAGRPVVEMTRLARGPFAGINGVVKARLTWPR